MRSRLFECRVSHARFAPRNHRFSYRAFYVAVDLDELPALRGRFRLLSIDAPNLFSINQRDFLPVDEPLHNPHAERPIATSACTGLRDRVVAVLARNGVAIGRGRIELIALPRMLGYQFNPVAFYFCRDEGGHPLAALVEVTNTFREVKVFCLGPETFRDGAFRLRITKDFYVSPFSDVDVEFEFILRPAGDRIAIRIDDRAAGERTFTSVLAGRARQMTDARLAWYLVSHPLLTLRVIALIHWHALRLALKRTPWYPKAARAGLQRDLRRPHASLTATSHKLPMAASSTTASTA